MTRGNVEAALSQAHTFRGLRMGQSSQPHARKVRQRGCRITVTMLSIAIIMAQKKSVCRFQRRYVAWCNVLCYLSWYWWYGMNVAAAAWRYHADTVVYHNRIKKILWCERAPAVGCMWLCW